MTTKLDLSNYLECKEFDDDLEIIGNLNSSTDELSAYLGMISDCKCVESVFIDHNAKIPNLKFLELFVNLEVLVISGVVESLNGIEKCQKLQDLSINFDRLDNDILNSINGKNYGFLKIQSLESEEVGSFSHIREIENLTLHNLKTSDLSFLSHIEVGGLHIYNSKLSMLDGFEKIKNISRLSFSNCQKLETIKSSSLVSLSGITIDTCNRLDLNQLKNCFSTRFLMISSCKRDVDLKNLLEVSSIEELTCNELNINYEVNSDIDTSSLKVVTLSPIKKKVLVELSEKFSNVIWKKV
ncbi:MAG: hypothetical protein HWE27_16265 [Gammaproteobacteria bacterium]|nr:hypothetical protein [Gammaproteobacteria bacterium]